MKTIGTIGVHILLAGLTVNTVDTGMFKLFLCSSFFVVALPDWAAIIA